SVIDIGDETRLYYTAWVNEAPLFSASVGLAIRKKGSLDFIKYGENPVLSKGEYDPWMVSSPWVFIVSDEWRAIYISGIKAELSDSGQKKSKYSLKYATSTNGIDWVRRGHVAIDFIHPGESNICRPSVIFEDGIYKMWFSY